MYDPTHPVPRWSTGTMRRVAAEPTLANAALGYANLGIPVFPCVPGGKQPLTPSGFHDATPSAAMVHQWWQRNPDANIGLPTGAVTGVLVVDVDVHSGGNGYEAFERARSAGLPEAGAGWSGRRPADSTPTTRQRPRSSSGHGRSRARTSTSVATAATSSLPHRESPSRATRRCTT